MALKKNLVNDVGVVTSYFRIANITQNFLNPSPLLFITVYGYADEGYRETEKTLADKDIQKINYFQDFILSFDESKGVSRADVYKRLKDEIEMFSGAEDV